MNIDFSNLKIQNLNPETDFDRKIVQFLENWFSESETIKVQTSGSTGIPKILEIEKQKMRNSAKMTCDFLALKQGDSALLCLPVEYISGKMMLVRAIERKLILEIVEPNSSPLQKLEKNICFSAMTPLQVQNSLDKIHLIKNLIIGGATVSENLKSQISNLKSQIFETYGMSETLSHIALKQISPISEQYFSVLENVKISLDERNCLTIFAPQLNSSILKTNDIVELKNDKQFRFLGRYDYVINSGGIKIFPEELENLLKKNISNELIFIGQKDEILGEKLVLVIEGNETEDFKSKISDILNEIEMLFSKNHKPKKIIFIKQIPRTPNGKVNRKALLNSF